MADSPATLLTTEPTMDALAAVIRRTDAPHGMESNLRQYLAERGVTGADLDQLVTVGAERLLVYRALVQNRMRNAIHSFIPRAIDRRTYAAYRDDFGGFMEQVAARSYYLRDVPAEFVQWVAPRWEADPDVEDFLVDLARHELLEIDVRNDPGGGETPTGRALDLEAGLLFDGSVRLMDYGFAIHRLPSAKGDRSAPERVLTRLLVYRDEAFKVRYLELTPFAAALLRQLVHERDAVRPALQAACERLGEPLDDDKLGSAAQLFADLAERKVILGATDHA